MANITQGATAASTGGSLSACSLVISGVATGEEMLVLAACSSASTPPPLLSGWTSLDSGSLGSTSYRLMSKTKTGGDTSPVSIGNAGVNNNATLASFGNSQHITAGMISTVVSNAATATTVDPGSLALNDGKSWSIIAVGGGALNRTFTFPSGWDGAGNQSTVANNARSVQIAWNESPGGDTVDPGVVTYSATTVDRFVWQIDVRSISAEIASAAFSMSEALTVAMGTGAPVMSPNFANSLSLEVDNLMTRRLPDWYAAWWDYWNGDGTATIVGFGDSVSQRAGCDEGSSDQADLWENKAWDTIMGQRMVSKARPGQTHASAYIPITIVKLAGTPQWPGGLDPWPGANNGGTTNFVTRSADGGIAAYEGRCAVDNTGLWRTVPSWATHATTTYKFPNGPGGAPSSFTIKLDGVTASTITQVDNAEHQLTIAVTPGQVFRIDFAVGLTSFVQVAGVDFENRTDPASWFRHPTYGHGGWSADIYANHSGNAISANNDDTDNNHIESVMRNDPDLVIIFLGVNDLRFDRTRAEFAADLQTLVSQLDTKGVALGRTKPSVNVAFATFTYIDLTLADNSRKFTRAEWVEFIRGADDAVAALGRRADHWRMTDVIPDQPDGAGFTSSDNIHPSAEGNRQIGEFMASMAGEPPPQFMELESASLTLAAQDINLIPQITFDSANVTLGAQDIIMLPTLYMELESAALTLTAQELLRSEAEEFEMTATMSFSSDMILTSGGRIETFGIVPTIAYPSTELEVRLVERDGTLITNLPHANIERATWELCAEGEAAFSINPFSSGASKIFPWDTEVQLWFNGELLWWGPVWSAGGSPKSEMAWQCKSVISLLYKRFIDVTSLIYGDATTDPVETIEQFTIASNLIDYAQSEDLQPFRDLNIDFASYSPSGVGRTAQYKLEEHKNILDLLKEFPKMFNGFEWDVDVLGSGQRLFHPYYPKKGELRSEFAMEFDESGARNMTDFDYREDFIGGSTDVIATGGSVDGIKIEDRYEDDDASERHGVMQKIVSAGSTLDHTTLQDRARKEVELNKEPIVMAGITSARTPDIDMLGKVTTGDWIPIRIDYGRYQVDALQRIQKIQWNKNDTLSLSFSEVVEP